MGREIRERLTQIIERGDGIGRSGWEKIGFLVFNPSFQRSFVHTMRQIKLRPWGTVLAMTLAIVLAWGFKGVVSAQEVSEGFSRDVGWNDTYSKGLSLFQDNCAVCHGDNGQGDTGLPLNLQSFLTIAPLEYIVRTINAGRPVHEMPSFKDELTPQEIKEIAMFVKSWQYSPSLPVEEGAVKGNRENGKELFQGICVGCHGLKGEGGPEAGVGRVTESMKGFPGPALADPGFQKSATDGFVKASLMYGRKGTPMVAFLKGGQGMVELSEEEINDLVSFVRTMEPIKVEETKAEAKKE